MMKFQPMATIGILKERAKLLDAVRHFFNSRGYFEVETPIMAQHGVTDPYLSNLAVQFRKQSYYLQTSPEYHMKRLLAAGSGPIYQLARVFRDDEWGRWHEPEFTMLEWYQPGVTHLTLLEEVGDLIQSLSGCQPMLRMTYEEAFLKACGISVFHASLDDFKKVLNRFELGNVLKSDEEDLDQYLYLLMTHVVEPYLASFSESPIALYDFPASQAMLSKVSHGIAERFEVYWKGIELANGFHELTEATTQRARFKADNDRRYEKGLPSVAIDERLLSALPAMPDASGVALGIDRLLALILGESSIVTVRAFPLSIA